MSSPPPIRSKILRILALPLVSLIALWGFVAYSSLSQVAGISQTQSRWQVIGEPIRQLIDEIQRERQLSAEAAGGTAENKALSDQRRVTNGKVDLVRQAIASAEGYEPGNAPTDVRALETAMDDLIRLRASADSGVITPLQVIDAYNAFITVANRQFGDSEALVDVSSFRVVRGMGSYSNTAEYIGREHAVLTVVLEQDKMTPAEHAAFVAAMTSRRNHLAAAERDMGPDLRAHYRELLGDEAYRRFQAAEDKIFAWDLTGKPPVEAAAWKADAERVLDTVDRQVRQELLRAGARGDEIKADAFLRVALVVGLGLLAVIVSITVSYRFGRSMINELRRLQTSAAELAEERLPRLVQRLRRGDDVDPAAEAPELDPADTAEVDRVVHAFSAVRRTAVEAAVGQATLRRGVGQVFLNLARRNQALLHRQLTLLDAMERRVEEPDILEDLFKIDHLTTRMRRHAENLIILSDAAPARRWRDPVPVFDVVRSAVLEVEDYTRLTVLPMPQAPLLVGAAVTDVIHLIAELAENATVFSPPNTGVHIRGMTAANGFALEIEDRGLGLNEATLDELNAKLAEPPEFDLADSDRLGLFVVARLAARHGIKVVLRPSPYDGTTAIVMLPPALLAAPESPVTVAGPSRDVPVTTPRPRRPVRALSAAPTPRRSGPESRDRLVAAAPDASERVTSERSIPELPARERPAPVGAASPDRGAAPGRVPGPEHGGRFETRPGRADPPSPGPVRPAAQVADDDLDGLPVRVRQASLAPQLRRAPAREQRDVSVRSPEELFTLMSSMQQGWQRGRGQAGQDQDVRNGKEGHTDGRPEI
ncbi:signal transduction histidine kinase [Streptosporangium becharense]|uniref:histidine kinase n=1 Tax=Streptosporangium becharense TaxID=1816182 RepID=A0A7W9IIG4_9ACTN|nr:nitrate- and nitrite sensing domain-containing protein [Streptosporangium becharense]MBB2912511.1 signal transduction histidine kinase [Streptosporangium becharense]MBB5820659.1 signal transduction histidine kinase [Streptosporangium becharense]